MLYCFFLQFTNTWPYLIINNHEGFSGKNKEYDEDTIKRGHPILHIFSDIHLKGQIW